MSQKLTQNAATNEVKCCFILQVCSWLRFEFNTSVFLLRSSKASLTWTHTKKTRSHKHQLLQKGQLLCLLFRFFFCCLFICVFTDVFYLLLLQVFFFLFLLFLFFFLTFLGLFFLFLPLFFFFLGLVCFLVSFFVLSWIAKTLIVSVSWLNVQPTTVTTKQKSSSAAWNKYHRGRSQPGGGEAFLGKSVCVCDVEL